MIIPITPEQFSVIAVGSGALVVAGVAVINMIATIRSNKKNREQVAKLAVEQAVATKLAADQAVATGQIKAQTHEIKVAMDGRMDELLSITRALASADGVKAGRDQVHAEIAADAAAAGVRDDKVIGQMSDAVVERIEQAADKAAQTIPASALK